MLSVDALQCKTVRRLTRSSYTIGDVSSSIQRVPLDLLHEIVLYCLPIHPTVQSASPVISSLSRVSSTWRAAVLSSPRLWSRLFLTIHEDDDFGLCAQKVTQWFQRARSVPLSFFLNIDFEALDEDIAPIHCFLDDLSSVMLRVQHFGLHSRLTPELLSAFVDLEWELPQLKKLDLFSHADLDQFNPVAFSVPLFQAAPNLVQVSIQNSITNAHHIQNIPWSQLSDINISYSIRFSRWIEIMKLCPKLRVLEVFFSEQDPRLLDSFPPQGTHHCLERLYLTIEGGPPFLKLLSLYSLPSLHTLHVLYHSEPLLDFSPPQGISALANVREFSFGTMGIEIPAVHIKYMTEVLRQMINLEEFELQQPTRELVALFDAVSFKRPEEALMLPRLQIVRLWISSESLMEGAEELASLFEMVSSRCEEGGVPVGYQPLVEFAVGVATEDVHERIKKVFEPWMGGLPPELEVSIDLSRSYNFDQPEGWTCPISE